MSLGGGRGDDAPRSELFDAPRSERFAFLVSRFSEPVDDPQLPRVVPTERVRVSSMRHHDRVRVRGGDGDDANTTKRAAYFSRRVLRARGSIAARETVPTNAPSLGTTPSSARWRTPIVRRRFVPTRTPRRRRTTRWSGAFPRRRRRRGDPRAVRNTGPWRVAPPLRRRCAFSRRPRPIVRVPAVPPREQRTVRGGGEAVKLGGGEGHHSAASVLLGIASGEGGERPNRPIDAGEPRRRERRCRAGSWRRCPNSTGRKAEREEGARSRWPSRASRGM